MLQELCRCSSWRVRSPIISSGDEIRVRKRQWAKIAFTPHSSNWENENPWLHYAYRWWVRYRLLTVILLKISASLMDRCWRSLEATFMLWLLTRPRGRSSLHEVSLSQFIQSLRCTKSRLWVNNRSRSVHCLEWCPHTNDQELYSERTLFHTTVPISMALKASLWEV